MSSSSIASPVVKALDAPAAHGHGADGSHAPAPRRARADGPRIGASILRLSLGARLMLAAALILPLWLAVILVVL